MPETKISGGNIANCERVKIVTIETTPKTYVIEVATNVAYAGAVSSGNEAELRVKNTIHGAIRTEDIVKGYDITMDDPLLHMQILALVDGGVHTPEAGEVLESYAAPVAGAPVSRTLFDLYVYTSDRDSDGEALAYHEWLFPSCKGKPVEGAMKDGEFASTSYKISNRPAAGVSPLTVQRIEELPSTVTGG